MPKPVIIAVVASYEELISVLVEHRGKLGLSQLAVDDLAGFHSGYTGKLEVGTRAKCGRGLGRMSLPTLLDTYGLRLAVIRGDRAGKVEARARRDAVAKSCQRAIRKAA